MNIAEWYEKKAALLEKIKEAATKARERAKDDDFDAETMNTEFEGWYKELEEVERTIKNLEIAEKAAADRAKPVDDVKPANKKEDKEAYDRAFFDWARNGEDKMNPENLAVLRAGQYSPTTTAGGFTIPTVMGDRIVSAQAFVGGMITPGLVRKIDTAGGEAMTFPVVNDTTVYGYLAAAAADLTASAAASTFAQKTLTCYKYTSGLVQVANELLSDSAFDFAGWLSEMLLERYYRGVNRALTYGTGSSQPNGLKTAIAGSSGEGVTAAVRTFTRTNLSTLMYSINRAYFFNATWMFNSTTLRAIRALVQSSTYNESPLWQESVRAGEPALLEGKPWIVNEEMDSSNITKCPIFFGDFRYYYWREVVPLRVIRLDERFMDTDEIGFAVLGRIAGELVASDYPIKSLRHATT